MFSHPTRFVNNRTWKYRLQLLFYKEMAEQAFQIKIKYAMIVALNPQEKTPKSSGFWTGASAWRCIFLMVVSITWRRGCKPF